VKVLVIGGNRFMGRELAWRLLAGGHQVTLFNRGTLADPFGPRVERLHGDRSTGDFARLLGGREFDGVVDFAAFTAADTRSAREVLLGRVGHYVMISTGQVYLVRAGCPSLAREGDYAGPLLPEPPEGHPDRADWEYGVGKRGAEDVLAQAWALDRFPSTRLRIPMVNGERDHLRRIEGYLWRLLDGSPLLVPDTGRRLRHVYAGEVVRLIVTLLTRNAPRGLAYNVCQEETPTLPQFLELLAGILGAPLRTVLVAPTQVEAAGLDLRATSPFSSRWMSLLDPVRARGELGFQHRPLRAYLETIVACFLAHPPAEPPPGYAQRGRELELAARA
jgi:nucleoside-diphosphate-sugar epimerase